MRFSTTPQDFMQTDTGKAILRNIATLGFIGHIPYAPGTFGSLCGIVVIYVLNLPHLLHGIFLACGFIVGIVASTAAEKLLQDKDSGTSLSEWALPPSWYRIRHSFSVWPLFYLDFSI